MPHRGYLMRYTHFTIRNFKGIEHVRLDLVKSPQSKVHTLIGLNESGKTTVLEAIDRLSYRESLDALSPPGYVQSDVHELIPIAKRANFNDSIVIEAGVSLDDDDQRAVRTAARKLGVSLADDIAPFAVTQRYKFTASRIEQNQPQITWSLRARGKTAGAKRPRILEGEAWQHVVNIIKPTVPRIVYFPNFLFEFPDLIYLESPPSDAARHEFYKSVLQDVLDAIGDGTNIGDHVLTRAKSAAEHDKRALESVLLKMGGHITATVFRNWDRIFKRPAGRKEITVAIDKDQRGAWHLKLRLKEGHESYEISERSLGFRWFFSYLLLTQYRGFRRHGTSDVVFLLDEPASNLHPSAQAQLLDSFQSLPEGCSVIYTTHSHHLIRPEWLDGAYVVKNEGLHYEGGRDEDYNARHTLISTTRYREFAMKHPNQTTYFQPVLDVLDYRPASLENVPDVVMLEGKGDFYTLKYVAFALGTLPELKLLPGMGAGSLDTVIRLYLAWARNFIVLLDSDKAGRGQKDRYISTFGPSVQGRIFTLADLDAKWADTEMEDLFEPSDRLAILRLAYPDGTEYNKTHFMRALQELNVTRRSIPLNPGTASAFAALTQSLQARLDAAALA